MHPLPRFDSTTWTAGGEPPEEAGPADSKRARHEAPAARSPVLELGRPALLQPFGPDEPAAGDGFRLIGRGEVNGPENERVSRAGQDWWLGRAAQEALHRRLPVETAAWTRRLVFSAFPQTADWRWLPAYRQRCPNLQEIVLPPGSEAVMPALRTHAVPEAGGQWVLRLTGRDDGVGAYQRLCGELGQTLDGHVARPGVLGLHGRPRVFRQLARDLPALRRAAACEPALIDRIGQLVAGMAGDPQIAWRCAHIAQVQGDPAQRLAAMSALAAELRRAPLAMPASFLPQHGSDALADMIFGFSRTPDPGPRRTQAAEPLFWPMRPRWLDRAEARAMAGRLQALPCAVLTPVLRAQRDAALRVLQPQAVFDDLVFLSREEEDLLVETLHLTRVFETRVFWRASSGPRALHPMPAHAKRVLAGLRQWVEDAPRDEGTLRRERWYLHLAGQAHAGALPFQAAAGLLRGAPGREDLDAPPVELVEAIARARGEPLGLTLDYRGELICEPLTVNRELSQRLVFGIRFSSACLTEEEEGGGRVGPRARMPAALQWPFAEWLAIDLAPQHASRGAQWRERLGAGLLADFPAMTRLFIEGPEAPGAESLFAPEAWTELQLHHRSMEEATRLLGALAWNGAQRFHLRVHAGFAAWLLNFIDLDRQTTGRAEGVWPPLLAQVARRALDDEDFATQCGELVRGQDGHCVDAHRRVLHQMSLLMAGQRARGPAEVAEAALAFACALRADQAVVESLGGFAENLEDAMLLRQALERRLRTRLGRPPGDSEPPVHARFGSAGALWNSAEEIAQRECRADALIDEEVRSGFAVSLDCLDDAGLVGDFLVRALRRDPGYATLEATLRGEAQARFEIAMDAAELLTDEGMQRQAVVDAASRRAAEDAAQLKRALQAHCRALFIPLAARLSRDPQTPAS